MFRLIEELWSSHDLVTKNSRKTFFYLNRSFLFERKKLSNMQNFGLIQQNVSESFSKSQATSKLQRNIANVAFRKAASSSSLKAMTKLKGKWKRKKRKKGKIDSLFLKQDNSKLIRFRRVFLIFHIFFYIRLNLEKILWIRI